MTECWHDQKRVTTETQGTGKVIRKVIQCVDCGLMKVLEPCTECGQLADKGEQHEIRD